MESRNFKSWDHNPYDNNYSHGHGDPYGAGEGYYENDNGAYNERYNGGGMQPHRNYYSGSSYGPEGSGYRDDDRNTDRYGRQNSGSYGWSGKDMNDDNYDNYDAPRHYRGEDRNFFERAGDRIRDAWQSATSDRGEQGRPYDGQRNYRRHDDRDRYDDRGRYNDRDRRTTQHYREEYW